MKHYLLPFILLFFFQMSFPQKNGPYEKLYTSGLKQIEGQYKNGKRVGEWKDYHPNGQVSRIYSYNNGKLNDEYVSYFENGQTSNEVKEVDGELISKGYFENGNLFYERVLYDGYYREYHKDGHLFVECSYIDGEISGEWKKYFDSGNVEWLVTYLDGYREGKYQQYYDNGQLKVDGQMDDDKKNGQERRYFENGQLEWEGRYYKGEFDKNWMQFDGSGSTLAKVKFNQGKPESDLNGINLIPTDVPDGLLEKIPVYPGCENGLTNRIRRQCMSSSISSFIMTKFNTDIADNMALSGKQKIYVIFKIDKEGKIIELDARAPHQELSYEAIRVVSLLPQMQPGYQRGEPVVVPYSLPIVFEIPEKKRKK